VRLKVNNSKKHNIRYAINWTVEDTRRLYWLIDQYLIGKINASTFADEYHVSYDMSIKREDLTEFEHEAFIALSDVAGRFSPFETDLRNYPGTYYSEAQLRKKALETKQKLMQQFAEYKSQIE